MPPYRRKAGGRKEALEGAVLGKGSREEGSGKSRGGLKVREGGQAGRGTGDAHQQKEGMGRNME